MSTDHGIDFDAADDIDYNWSVQRDQRLVYLQAMYRRFNTVRGRLFYNRGYGYSLWQQLLETGLTEGELALEIKSEALKDERTKNVIVTFEPQKIVIRFIPHFSPHPLTMTLDKLTNETILEQS